MYKEMPEWLKKYYNMLWKKHRREGFTFNDVEKELHLSKAMTVKTLWELENKGFLSKERSKIDYRARVYRLISPEDISFVIGFCSLLEEKRLKEKTLIDKLALINGKLPYAITGSHAAYYYHRYMHPSKVIEIKIKSGDEGKWIAYLTDEETRVFTGKIIEKRKISNYVKLVHSTWPPTIVRVKTERGYYIEKPEFLIIELLERQTQTSITEAVAIIVSNKDKIKWNGRYGLVNLARNDKISRVLGFLLDAINYEAYKPLIKQEIIRKIKEDAIGNTDEIFPRDTISLSRFRELRNKIVHEALLSAKEREELYRTLSILEGYKKLSEKWGFQAILPRHIIRKVLEDLGVKLGKKRNRIHKSKRFGKDK